METVAPPQTSINKDLDTFNQVRHYLAQQIIGQENLIQRLLIALLAGGHLLIEGPPGLAKTTAAKTLADCLHASFQRIQFTPDLLPADLTGTDVFRPKDGSFHFQPGPLFHNIILADEINRAPAKVQSALLEAMAEQQISIGNTRHELPKLFMVLATQNPIEQEGTYPLPEAELDRFLLYVCIDYPHQAETEQAILALNRLGANTDLTPPGLNEALLFRARRSLFSDIHLSAALERYLVELILTSRRPERHSQTLAKWLDFGASPRASIALEHCARAQAWLAGRDYVTPEDIHSIAHDVLRHRILLNYAAVAEGKSSDDFIDELLRLVPTP